MFPEPTSQLALKAVLFNAKDPGSVCGIANELEEKKLKEVDDCIKAQDWDCSSKILDELKLVERLRHICRDFPK